MKTTGLTPHSILLIEKGHKYKVPQDEENKTEESKLKKLYKREKGLYLKEYKSDNKSTPQGGRKSIHLRRASLSFFYPVGEQSNIMDEAISPRPERRLDMPECPVVPDFPNIPPSNKDHFLKERLI